MNLSLYQSFFSNKSFDDLVDYFHDTLVDTNRGYKFFVNWEKIKQNVEKYRIELNLLNSLVHCPNFNLTLRKVVTDYPEVLPVIPLLLAIRDIKIKVIKDFTDADSDTVVHNFKKRSLSNQEIEELITFFERTGLKDYFQNMSCQNIQDYVTGVEVGLDTHARKNRSGEAMELVVGPIIQEIVKRRNLLFQIENQKYFRYLVDHYDLEISTSLLNRKADFVLVGDKNKIVNIEVNFFSGKGSKPQEIVDSYINRQNELLENGFYFIWITDGFGWKGQKNQIRKGLEMIDYPRNLHFARKGLLEKILCQILQVSN